MSGKPKKKSRKAPESICQSKITVICACGKKLEHAHYTFPTKEDVEAMDKESRTGHGQPLSFPKKHTSKKFKK